MQVGLIHDFQQIRLRIRTSLLARIAVSDRSGYRGQLIDEILIF